MSNAQEDRLRRLEELMKKGDLRLPPNSTVTVTPEGRVYVECTE